MVLYDAHKATTDAALPTPDVVWQMLDADDEAYRHHEIGLFVSEFAGERFSFVCETHDNPDAVRFHIVEIIGSRRRSTGISDGTWAECRRVFAAFWEARCESIRVRRAQADYGRGLLSSAGALDAVSEDARLRSLAATSGLFTLRPPFATDVLAYTGTTRSTRVELALIRFDNGATVQSTLGDTVVNGLSPSFDLELGSNVISIVVTAQDGFTTGTYTISLTRN